MNKSIVLTVFSLMGFSLIAVALYAGEQAQISMGGMVPVLGPMPPSLLVNPSDSPQVAEEKKIKQRIYGLEKALERHKKQLADLEKPQWPKYELAGPETADAVKKLRSLGSTPKPAIGDEIRILKFPNDDAIVLAQIVQQFFPKLQMAFYQPKKVVLVKGTASDIEAFEALLKRLDQEGPEKPKAVAVPLPPHSDQSH